MAHRCLRLTEAGPAAALLVVCLASGETAQTPARPQALAVVVAVVQAVQVMRLLRQVPAMVAQVV